MVNYHGNLDFDWLLAPVTMVVAIDGKVSINGKFYATGAWCVQTFGPNCLWIQKHLTEVGLYSTCIL